jgi:hypothetical protein
MEPQMATKPSRPGITVRAKTGKTYHAKSRRILITEFRVSIEDWGKLQGVVLREAARGFGIQNGEIVFRLGRPDQSDATFAEGGTLSLVRRGARRSAS